MESNPSSRTTSSTSRDTTAKTLLMRQNRELRKQLAVLRRSRAEMIQRERLHALGQMASGIVHDFNNALTPILSASDFLLANPHMLSRRPEPLRLIKNISIAARDAKSMVVRLRDFYRPSKTVDLTVVDVNTLVEDAIMLTRPRWREQALASNIDVRIRRDLAAGCNVLIDASHLREVLANLIINATDALQRDGTVTIRTRSNGGHVTIEVSDTGSGMTGDVRRHCFEPFYSTKGKDGTGLGLSVAYGIIRNSHGTIKVAASTPGKGTTIQIRLPVAKSGYAATQTKDSVGQKTPPMKILVCEKDQITRWAVAQHLRHDDHRVDIASTGKAALTKMRASQYDLIVLDSLVPSGTSESLASMMRKEFPSCVMVITGSLGIAGKETPSRAVANAVLNKPFTQKELREAIAAAGIKAGRTVATE